MGCLGPDVVLPSRKVAADPSADLPRPLHFRRCWSGIELSTIRVIFCFGENEEVLIVFFVLSAPQQFWEPGLAFESEHDRRGVIK